RSGVYPRDCACEQSAPVGVLHAALEGGGTEQLTHSTQPRAGVTVHFTDVLNDLAGELRHPRQVGTRNRVDVAQFEHAADFGRAAFELDHAMPAVAACCVHHFGG